MKKLLWLSVIVITVLGLSAWVDLGYVGFACETDRSNIIGYPNRHCSMTVNDKGFLGKVWDRVK